MHSTEQDYNCQFYMEFKKLHNYFTLVQQIHRKTRLLKGVIFKLEGHSVERIYL